MPTLLLSVRSALQCELYVNTQILMNGLCTYTSFICSFGRAIRAVGLPRAAGVLVVVAAGVELCVEEPPDEPKLFVPVKNAAPMGITHFRLFAGGPSLNPTDLFFGLNLLITRGLFPFRFDALSFVFDASVRAAVAEGAPSLQSGSKR